MSLNNLSFPQLQQLHKDLYANVAGDPTFMAAAGVLLRALIADFMAAAREKHEAEQKAAAEAQPEAGEAKAQDPEMAEAGDDTSHSRRRR